MTKALETLVDLESGSADIDGIRRVRNQIADWLEQSGILTERIETSAGSPALWASVGQDNGAPAIFLTGHMDTVFPKGTTQTRPYREENGRGYGPGVADMKSGLVMNVFVCRALHELQETGVLSLPAPVKILFTSDEA